MAEIWLEMVVKRQFLSLLFFVTPSSKGQLVRAYLDTILMTLVEPKITKSVYVLHTAICIL